MHFEVVIQERKRAENISYLNEVVMKQRMQWILRRRCFYGLF